MSKAHLKPATTLREPAELVARGLAPAAELPGWSASPRATPWP